jgi:hypothetical protein
MFFRVLADLVVLMHLAFILFVVLGALLALRWRWIPWVQVPAALWGAVIEVGGWVCPLTPLENGLRERAGDAGYTGGFVEHYVLPVVYPGSLTRGVAARSGDGRGGGQRRDLLLGVASGRSPAPGLRAGPCGLVVCGGQGLRWQAKVGGRRPLPASARLAPRNWSR